jgi:hypothetical protein
MVAGVDHIPDLGALRPDGLRAVQVALVGVQLGDLACRVRSQKIVVSEIEMYRTTDYIY